MTLDQFVPFYDGKTVDTDGYYGGQCMDLMHRYIFDVVGNSDPKVLAAPAAKDVYINFSNMVGRDLFTKVDNTPTGVPPKGAIIFWGTQVGQFGHVAIVLNANVNTFESFDQNWNGVQRCQKITHNYNGVLGWLTPKPKAIPAVLPIDLQKYSYGWKTIAINKGLDVNAPIFADYQAIDLIIAQQVRAATEPLLLRVRESANGLQECLLKIGLKDKKAQEILDIK